MPMLSPRSLAAVLPLALLPLSLPAGAPRAQGGPAAEVAAFVGPPGGVGDVVVVAADGQGPPAAVAGLAGVVLLPIDAAGQSPITALLPDAPRLSADVAGATRVRLPHEQGSLYRFRRDEPGGGAAFGFFRVDAAGAAGVVLERTGSGPAGDQDPFLERVGVDSTGGIALVATTNAAGGDLLELDLAAGTAVDRTANLAPLTWSSAGGRLPAAWGLAVAQEGIVRFQRAPGAQAELVAIPGIAPPAWWDGGVVLSADASTAATIAGSAPDAAHVICLGPTGDARPLDTTPQALQGAGFLPQSTSGPHLGLSTDGSAVAWITVAPAAKGTTREAWLARTTPLAGETPQHVTANAKFLDTLDETGLIGFSSGTTMLFGVGERADPLDPLSTDIDGLDLYTATLNPDGIATVANLSLTSGVASQPFPKGELGTEEGIHFLPGGQALVMNKSAEILGRVSIDAPGVQPLLPQTKDLRSVHGAGDQILVHARSTTGSSDRRLYAYDVPSGTLTHLASLPDGTVFERHALRSDGTAAFVVRLLTKEWVARVDLATAAGALAAPTPVAFGPALALTAGGDLALTVGAAGSPGLTGVWTALGLPVLLPLPIVPAQVLPGSS